MATLSKIHASVVLILQGSILPCSLDECCTHTHTRFRIVKCTDPRSCCVEICRATSCRAPLMGVCTCLRWRSPLLFQEPCRSKPRPASPSKRVTSTRKILTRHRVGHDRGWVWILGSWPGEFRAQERVFRIVRMVAHAV